MINWCLIHSRYWLSPLCPLCEFIWFIIMLTEPLFLCGLLGAVTFQRSVEYWPINRLWAVKWLSLCRRNAGSMSWSKDARRKSSRWQSRLRNILSAAARWIFSWLCFLICCLSLYHLTNLGKRGIRVTLDRGKLGSMWYLSRGLGLSWYEGEGTSGRVVKGKPGVVLMWHTSAGSCTLKYFIVVL